MPVASAFLPSFFESFDDSTKLYVAKPELRFCFDASDDATLQPGDKVVFPAVEKLCASMYGFIKHASHESRVEALIGGAYRQSEPNLRLADVSELLANAGSKALAKDLENALMLVYSCHTWPNVSYLTRTGGSLLARGRLDKAMKCMKDAAKLDPNYYEAKHKLAAFTKIISRKLNRKSLDMQKDVLAQNPKHFGALAGCAEALKALGEPLEAIEFARRALTANPWATNIASMLNSLEFDEGAKRDILASGSFIPKGYFPDEAASAPPVRTEIDLSVYNNNDK